MSQKFIFVNSNGDYEETAGAYEISDFVYSTTGVADAGKPIRLDGTGLLDPSFINNSGIDHGSISGLGDDDHTQYILVNGTRAFTGNVSLGGFLITNLASPSDPNDAVNKQYVDAIATGIRPHGNVIVATTGNIDIASAPAAIDGVTLSLNDRILVKNQSIQTQNGIYVFNGAGSALTRAADFDNSPEGEILNGAFIPIVLSGTTNIDTSWIVTSVGTGTGGVHQIGTDIIVFELFTTPSQLTGGDGIVISSNIVQVDLLDADSGLAFLGAGFDELAINWASDFTIDAADALAVKASFLASTANGYGASMIGVEDTAGNFVGTNVEAILAEIAADASSDYIIYTSGGTIAKGDPVYISGNNTVLTMPITTAHYCIGIAGNDALIGEDVQVMKDDTLLLGVLSAATAGTKYYWDGGSYSTAMPGTAGYYIWMVGTAKNATDLQVESRFIKRNNV